MRVILSLHSAEMARRAGADLEPLARELRQRPARQTAIVQAELWPHKGVCVCRFVRADGRRYDASLGLHIPPQINGDPAKVAATVDVLLRRTTVAMARAALEEHGVLTGLSGALNPAR